MSHVRGHLVTGGTGLVGRAFARELLATSTVDVAALVRPGEEPAERPRRALVEAATVYGASGRIRAANARRCRAVVADLDEPRGPSRPPAPRVKPAHRGG